MARFLVTLGVILVVAGLAWPLLGKLGLGRLPGDIHIERGGFSFYFPITTGLVISAVISLILWLLRK
jgi:ribose/xylose/arabinose/galactoside ABC-type transport system permease subunit